MNLNLIVENTSPFDTERAGARFHAKRQTAVTVNPLGLKEIRACKVLKIISSSAPATPPQSKPRGPAREPARKILEPYNTPETVEKTVVPEYSPVPASPVKKTKTKQQPGQAY